MGRSVPLSVLDLSPVSSGGTPAQALRNTLDLAGEADRLGYRRFWVGEHHFSRGLASSAPPVLIAAVAARTRRIRVGAGGMLMGHRTALDVAEQFGTLEALYPGRIDLGVGRSAHRGVAPAPAAVGSERRVGALRVPAATLPGRPIGVPLQSSYSGLLSLPGARAEDFGDQVCTILSLLGGDLRIADGTRVPATAAEAAFPEVWVLGSGAGVSPEVAGRRGLPFAASFHVTPATVLDAIDAYRAAFRPSLFLNAPYVMVSADVVVAPQDAEARRLASGYGLWLLRIRRGLGALPYPSVEEAESFPWEPDDRARVRDRVDTQFVGSPDTVRKDLAMLVEATRADELLITTITHGHRERLRSYRLLAECWEG